MRIILFLIFLFRGNVLGLPYLDQSRHFILQYPRHLYPVVSYESGYVLSFRDDEGLAHFSLLIENTNFSSVPEWILNVNGGLPQKAKMVMEAEYRSRGLLFVRFNVPIVVDEDADQKSVYVDRQEIVFIKKRELYVFLMNENLTDPVSRKEFNDMVRSIRFY